MCDDLQWHYSDNNICEIWVYHKLKIHKLPHKLLLSMSDPHEAADTVPHEYLCIVRTSQTYFIYKLYRYHSIYHLESRSFEVSVALMI